MVTLNREYFVNKVNETREKYKAQMLLAGLCQANELSKECIKEIKDKEAVLRTIYRLSITNLERFDLGKLVHSDGVGYVSNYLKS